MTTKKRFRNLAKAHRLLLLECIEDADKDTLRSLAVRLWKWYQDVSVEVFSDESPFDDEDAFDCFKEKAQELLMELRAVIENTACSR